ncbi:MAG: hypothetical protein JNK05_22030 [Myxococcales bacterium]|nr:hypothetical protein [Myxococcales bacterium]
MSDELQQALDEAQWLRPEAAITRLDRDAEVTLAGYADELTACFERYASKELRPARLFVTRSAREASARWTKVIAEGAHSNPDPENADWRNAMTRVMEHRMRLEPHAASIPDALASFRARLEESAVPLPASWRPAWNLLLPGFFTLYRHVHIGRVLEKVEHRGPSPWGPLAALWARGCWPVLCASGELIVWVPASRDGEIVADADVASDEPRKIDPGMLYGGEHLPPGRLGIILTVRNNSMWVQPLSAKSIITASGSVSQGSSSATDDAIAALTYQRAVMESDGGAANNGFKRYVVQVTKRASLLRNGAETSSFVLTPGDVIEALVSGGRSQLYYLGANARDGESAMPTTHD